MRFLLLNTDYQSFLDQLYRRERGLAWRSHDAQMHERNASFFGVGDAYARALRRRGHEAQDIHMNNAFMQAAWAREHGPKRLRRRFPSVNVTTRRGVVPWIDRRPDSQWLRDVLATQIGAYRPDIIVNHDITWLPPRMLREFAGPSAVLVGQHAAPPYPKDDYTAYDLIVSSWPPLIERMRAAGIRAEHLGLGFDPAVLERLGEVERDLPLTFVGSFSDVHRGRTELIEGVCSAHPEMRIFAPSVRGLPKSSPIHHCYAGPAFGLEMFRVLARSRVTINHHGFPQPHANNMRLFEATGVGALLLTDAKPDLEQYFERGTEVLTYDSIENCVSTIRDLSSETHREVSVLGQRRTMKDHTWDRRVERLLALLD